MNKVIGKHYKKEQVFKKKSREQKELTHYEIEKRQEARTALTGKQNVIKTEMGEKNKQLMSKFNNIEKKKKNLEEKIVNY